MPLSAVYSVPAKIKGKCVYGAFGSFKFAVYAYILCFSVSAFSGFTVSDDISIKLA